MVEKVHAFTQEEIAKIKSDLGLTSDPKYVSKFQLPVLSTDVSYKNMANVLLNEAFMLPSGEIVKIDPQYVLDGNFVKLVAPNGLEGNAIFAENKNGGYSIIYQKTLDPVAPEDVLVGGKAPEGAQIVGKKLVWTEPFIKQGVILSNSMLSGYRIVDARDAVITDDVRQYKVKVEGDEVIAYFDSINIVNGSAYVYLIKDSSIPANMYYDEVLLVEFKGRNALPCDDEWEGCNATSSLLVLLTFVPFMVIRRKK
jgi:hypothetical protein